jgi:hypothetical protein
VSAPYRTILDQIRLSFPQPVSDRIHDAYFVFSIMRAFDDDTLVRVHPAPIGRLDPERWWRERATLREGLFELQKLIYYRLMYALGRSA